MSFQFNRHAEIEGKHAFLSASKYHWIRYDEAKMADVFRNFFAAEQGTRMHDFASHCIRMGQKLPRTKQTLNMFVNDAVEFGLSSEVVLYYSRNCFGTTDAIGFRNGVLRIHDYKSGVIPAHFEQLFVYAALFCLEYDVAPEDIQIELRIYQSGEIQKCRPEPEVIREVMRKAVDFDMLIESIKEEERAN